jgi:hypothetical protein
MIAVYMYGTGYPYPMTIERVPDLVRWGWNRGQTTLSLYPYTQWTDGVSSMFSAAICSSQDFSFVCSYLGYRSDNGESQLNDEEEK